MMELGMATSIPTTEPEVTGAVRREPVPSPSDRELMEHRVRRALSGDIRLLGNLLGNAIRRQAGEEAFELVEEIRSATKNLRALPSPEVARGLRDRLAGLGLPALRTLIRAFSIYFDLINLAEQRVRLRVLRWQANETKLPASDGFEAALLKLRETGVTAEQITGLLKRALIVPVYTAHPSEARRRTILEKLDSISQHMDCLESEHRFPREREAALAGIREEVETFWLSSLVRSQRPTVLDEVRQGVGMVQSLFEVVPRLYREIEAALRRVYPEVCPEGVPSFLKFGSWIGGDRDGHPNVTHAVTVEAVRVQQEMILEHYLGRINELGRRLSLSDEFTASGPEFKASLAREEAEVWPCRRASTDASRIDASATSSLRA